MTGPQRILFVCHYYPPHLGGIENVVRDEATRLAAAGAQVVVLCSGERTVQEEIDGVRVIRVAAWNELERRAGVPFPIVSPRLAALAWRWARWADVMHVHECLYMTSWTAGLASLTTRTPMVLTQHVALVEHPSAVVRAVQRIVYATVGRTLLRRARTVFTLNANVAQFVTRFGARPDRMRHLPNGVDTERFRPAADEAERAAARERFGLPAGRVLVLFVGRLVPKKGLDLLLGAAGGEYDLVFAGNGDASALDGVPGVHYLGALTPQQLALVYRACDVFALPSTGEGFPLTVQEAMASGLSVVTSDDPGYTPYAVDRELVRLVPRAAGAVRAALLELAGDPESRSRAGKYARLYAETEFSWPRHVETLVGRYRDAAGGRSAEERT